MGKTGLIKMSSKQTTNKRNRAQIKPIETILTRHKSSLLKRQLRNKDQTREKISQITQLLRSPTNTEKRINTHKPGQAKSPRNLKRKISESLKKDQNALKISGKNIKKEDDAEYYPSKLKRKVQAKKLVLKPKHEFKVIGSSTVNKRKRTVPQKEIKLLQSKCLKTELNPSKSPKPSNIQLKGTQNTLSVKSDLSVEDIVRIQETETLNDEDWLEILTCESPVWWEDPPDEEYIEDAICKRAPVVKTTQKFIIKSIQKKKVIDATEDEAEIDLTTVEESINTIKTNTMKLPNTKQADDKFMSKRTKLEKLLGNIKNKLNNHEVLISDDVNHDTMTDDLKSDSNIKNKSNTEKAQNEIKKGDDEIEKGDDEIEKDDTEIEKDDGEIEKDADEIEKDDDKNENNVESKLNVGESSIKTKEKRYSESTEGDDEFSSLGDDEILRDLENIDIPVEPGNTKLKSTEECVRVEEVNPNSSENPTNTFLGSGKDSHLLDPIIKNNIKTIYLKTALSKLGDATININKDLKAKAETGCLPNLVLKTPTNVPQNLFITSIEKEFIASPNSLRSISDDNLSIISSINDASSIVSGQDNLDSISDTNIRFIDDDGTSSDKETENDAGDLKNNENEGCEVKKNKVLVIKEIKSGNKQTLVENHEDKLCENIPTTESVTANGQRNNRNDNEYMTVYKIIPNDNEADEISGGELLNALESKGISKNNLALTNGTGKTVYYRIKTASKEDNNFNKNLEKKDPAIGNKNSLLKKFKNTYQRRPRSRANVEDTVYITKVVKDVKSNEEEYVEKPHKVTFCETSDSRVENSIVVSDTDSVKYCLKCSCIFNTTACTYCVKKTEQAKTVSVYLQKPKPKVDPARNYQLS